MILSQKEVRQLRFQNKVVLIVGGNSGIGLSAASLFGQEGATVIITGRDETTLKRAADSIPGATAFRCDIADPDTLDTAMAAIRAVNGRIDVLFVNAGIGAFASVREVTPALWDQVHAVNVRGCFFAVQKALPLMGRGSAIVLTGSVGSVLGIPGNVMYASAKAGLRAAARILAAELVAEGIRVNMVSPGPTETPIINRNVGMDPGAIDSLRRTMIQAIPMKRMGEPEEIARAVLFLASQEASFITGVDLFVDGGCVEL
jgi:NAD(P)-dependent dehydrogenase (short-subunit alcohol dehydrogenase family)